MMWYAVLEMFDVIFLSCGGVWSSQYRTFHITPAPLAAAHRLFHFAIGHISNRPHYASWHGHISHCTPFHITCVPHNATFHVLHDTSVSDHAIYWPHRTTTSRTTFYTTLHRISHAPHLASVPHLTVITPNSTSHNHVSHSIPHHTSVHHHILHPTTCHISHNTISTNAYRAVS